MHGISTTRRMFRARHLDKANVIIFKACLFGGDGERVICRKVLWFMLKVSVRKESDGTTSPESRLIKHNIRERI